MSDFFSIRSYRSTYQVRFCADFSADLKSELREGDFLVVDANIATLHANRVDPLRAAHPHWILQPAEPQKSYQGVEPLMDHLIRNGFRKNHRLVAIGGGITQDVTAFIASILYRGVGWIFVPTNLLSQADSCIGSKTSINFGAFKNQIGGFHPPVLILNDLSLLDTLPRDEIRSGMGEMMHYFLLTGRADFERVSREYDAALTDRTVLRGLIRRSLEIKKAMIERDEFDEGPRNVFNYGHSFGHALESYTDYAIPHGIAICFGMDIANHVSAALGLISEPEAAEMRVILQRNWRPTVPVVKDLDRYLDLLRKDKKNVGSDVRVILTRGLGDMFLTKIPLDGVVLETIRRCFDYYQATPAATAS
ncbi:MAG: 3-dehydroquinate synthase [Verrucomicrobia bacterium]|nr:3-dehydroquinate synthase [Verrucomicrobiota bacterium]